MESVNIVEASKRIGVTTATVSKMLTSRRLTGYKHRSGRWDVSVRSINDLIRKRKEAQRQ